MQNLKKKSSNKNTLLNWPIFASFAFLLIAASCNPTKYVPEGEYLLDNNNVVIKKEEGIKKSDLIPYIRQKPNKRIFGARFHLGLYNLSNINKKGWPHSWLRNIGEEPVVYDPFAMQQSREQIESYIGSKGYFDSEVTDSVFTEKRKSDVYYKVDLSSPYTIRRLIFEIEDTTIRKLFYFDSVNCLIERGKPYDVDVLQSERTRLERTVKDRGFYGFSGDHIFFDIDSTAGNRQVDVYYRIRNLLVYDQFNRPRQVSHSIYSIRNVYIYPDFVPGEVIRSGETYTRKLDTLFYKGYYFITADTKPDLNYDVIIQSMYIRPGSPYNITNTEQSQSHLLGLKTYRLVNIYYSSLQDSYGGEQVLLLDCHVQLTLLSQQSFRVDLEGTNSAGNFGGGLNLTYQHKNLLRGAEQFSLKLKGAYEALPQNKAKLRSSQEYSIETSLRLPKFLLPFLRKEEFIRNYNPTTSMLAAYNYMDMPLYRRTIANITFGYNWNAGDYKTHIVNPVQMNLVKLLYIDSAFLKKYGSSYLSYRDVMILGAGYSYIYNNQSIKKSRDYWFIRLNAELAGNMLAAVSGLSGAEKVDGSYQAFRQPFAQYLRGDIDVRYNFFLNDVSSIVYRGFAGAGIPYGNSRAIPFEKQYFGGGANGLRAWQVRSLGPGSFISNDSIYFNQTADIKLEFNTEYRFKLFWLLEGALFLDAGNIWTYNSDTDRPGSQFSLQGIYRDMAVGTGAGLRFDFSFFLARLDLGMKLRDPVISEGSKWIAMNRPYNFKNDFTLVFAIGYPF